MINLSSFLRNRKLSFLLALITLITCLLISTGSFQSIDAFRRFQVTKSLWQDVPQVALEDTEYVPVIGRDGNPYATWGIGQSLVMLPGDILASTLLESVGATGEIANKVRAALVCYFTFPIINILSVLLSFQLLKLLGFSIRQSFIGALSLLFGTTFLIYAQVHQENSLMFLLILSGYFFTLKWLSQPSKTRFLYLASITLGFNLLVRMTTLIDILLVGSLALTLSVYKRKSGVISPKELRFQIFTYIKSTIPIYLIFIAADRLYHWSRFGTFLGTYQGIWGDQMKILNPDLPDSFPFSNNLLDGLSAYLLSPNNSILLFDPLIAVTLILLIKYWNNISFAIRILSFTFIGSLILYMPLYAKWFDWSGGGSWGPRFLSVPAQLLAMLAVPLFLKFSRQVKSIFFKRFLKLTIFSAFTIQLSSVIFDYNLEITQDRLYSGELFVVGQRFINIFSIVSGESVGLNLNIPEAYSNVIFLPWEEDLPTAITALLKLPWFVGFALLLFLLVFSFQKISRKERFSLATSPLNHTRC